jgi:hypothetical protein
MSVHSISDHLLHVAHFKTNAFCPEKPTPSLDLSGKKERKILRPTNKYYRQILDRENLDF